MEDDDSLDLCKDYMCIRLVPKEKELKVKFRAYGCKPYFERLRSLVQEKNGMVYLDMFSDDQAMTLSELQLAKNIHQFHAIADKYPGHEIFYFSIDVTAWNNKFRPETVHKLMENTLDKIFSIDFFRKTHYVYNQSLIYITDEESTIYWDGQCGGIDGLNQDTWVITYLAQLKYAFLNLGYKYHLLCKGDDLRAAVVPVPNTMLRGKERNEFVDIIILALKDAATKFGHEVNIKESYGSQKIFTFSKDINVSGVALPSGLRKIQKAYGSNALNAFFPVLDDYVASTFSTAHSTSAYTTTCYAPYYVALNWTYYYLLSHPIYAGLSESSYISF